MLHGRTRRDTCRNGKDRRDAADTADGHHEKDAADLTDGRLGGRVTRKEIYETELPHRAVAVYLYLRSSVQSMIWSVQDLYRKSRDGVKMEERAACSMKS